MKLLIAIAVIVQLSLADETNIKVVLPPNEKLYPVFELIATKMQVYNKKLFSMVNGLAKDLLPEYHKFMETHNIKQYEAFSGAFEKLLSSVEQFTKDPENCQLQRAAFADVAEINWKKPGNDELSEFFENFMDIHFKDDHSAILEICEQFPELMKNFIESLKEEEKEKYAKLYNYAEEIIKAPKGEERIRAINSFIAETKYNENLTEPNDENCKWDVVNFHVFKARIVSLQHLHIEFD